MPKTLVFELNNDDDLLNSFKKVIEKNFSEPDGVRYIFSYIFWPVNIKIPNQDVYSINNDNNNDDGIIANTLSPLSSPSDPNKQTVDLLTNDSLLQSLGTFEIPPLKSCLKKSQNNDCISNKTLPILLM